MNEILLGDCQELLKKIENESIHLTCTSPPYYNARTYSIWPTYEDYLQFLTDVFSEVLRVTKLGRMCVVNLSPVIEARESRAHESKRYPIPFHFFSLMEKIGWKYIDDIVWLKPEGSAINRNGGFFQHRKPVAYKPNLVTETIFVFQKPANFLIDKIVRSYKDEILEQSLVTGEYERSNVWKINPETSGIHPAPYPQELSNKIIKYYSYVNDIVLDPFMGSGTTALSCVELKRQFLGMEIHQEYIDIAQSRLSPLLQFNKLFK